MPTSAQTKAKRPNSDLLNDSLMRAARRDMRRLKEVLVIVAKHGFGELAMKLPFNHQLRGDVSSAQAAAGVISPAQTAPRRFKKLLEALGPTYIKFGQVLSMRPDMLPPEFVKSLEELQDKAPPVPFAEVRQVIESCLQKPLQDLYSDFDPTPLASASISQVHLARTKSGDRVVVKVQRPNIEDTMRGDLDLLFLIAKLLEASIEEVQILAPSEALAEFEKALVRELDFTEELRNLSVMKERLDPDRSIVVPDAYPELSGKSVLTMEHFAGRSVRDIVPGTEMAEHIAGELLHAAIKQVMIDGFFHGDPHAGNLLYNDEGQICMIDLGLAGRITDTQKTELVSLVFGIMAHDAGTVSRTLLRMGTPTQRVNLSELRSVTARLMDQYLRVESLEDLKSSELASEFVREAQNFKIKLAPEYVVLSKAAMTLEHIITSLDPNIDIAGMTKPYIDRILTKKFSWKTVISDSIGGVMGLGSLLRQIPVQLEQILHDTETGHIQVTAMTPQLGELPSLVHQLGSRITLMGFAASMTLTATLLIALEKPESPHPVLIGFCVFFAFASWTYLWIWHLLGRGRPLRLRSLTQFLRR